MNCNDCRVTLKSTDRDGLCSMPRETHLQQFARLFPNPCINGPYTVTEHTWNADGKPIVTCKVDGFHLNDAAKAVQALNDHAVDGATGYHYTFDRTVPIVLPFVVYSDSQGGC